MTEQPSFRTVLRGYEPSQVEDALRSRDDAITEARGRADDLARHGDELERRVAELEVALRHRDGSETEADDDAPFRALGSRVAQILELARAEADEVRDSALRSAQERTQGVEATAAASREAADRYASQTREAADAEAARVVEEARRRADGVLDAAERDAAARREESEAHFEQQRARASQAASDFETTLAQRRERAERDLSERADAAEAQLLELRSEVERVQVESDRSLAEAGRRATRVIEEAQATADEIVAEAKIRAERIRAESDRETAASAQRRDSINAQLVNVRQMLASLSGGTVPVDPFDQADDEPREVVEAGHGNEPSEAAQNSEDLAAGEADEALDPDAEAYAYGEDGEVHVVDLGEESARRR